MIFLAVRKQTSTDAIIVSIANLIDKSNEHKHTYFTIGDQLKDFNDIAIQLKPGIQEPIEGNIDWRTTTTIRIRRTKMSQQKAPISFNNAIKKKQGYSWESFYQTYHCWD